VLPMGGKKGAMGKAEIFVVARTVALAPKRRVSPEVLERSTLATSSSRLGGKKSVPHARAQAVSAAEDKKGGGCAPQSEKTLHTAGGVVAAKVRAKKHNTMEKKGLKAAILGFFSPRKFFLQTSCGKHATSAEAAGWGCTLALRPLPPGRWLDLAKAPCLRAQCFAMAAP
jgi:hypothetical protein